MNILLLASHAVAEYDDVRMFSDLGYDVFAPGGYEDPSTSGEGIRPALPDAPDHPELRALCREQREKGGEPGDAIDWAKADLHPDLVEWADAIIVHHFPDRWIAGQWDRIRHKRVIWRTCGQSNDGLEEYMRNFRGLQVVRYSPAEKRHYERRGCFAGQDALIRFGKYPDDYGPWIGDKVAVGNVTQDMVARGDSCGLSFWKEATKGLPTWPAGKGSEVIGGTGQLSYWGMLAYLRHIRVYLYTGTRPASYTLGLIEAMLTGVPVVSIGAQEWGEGWDGADLFEGADITGQTEHNGWPPGLEEVRGAVELMLKSQMEAEQYGILGREHAIRLFGIETIGRQWREFLGG